MRTVTGVAIPSVWDRFMTQIPGNAELRHSIKWDTQTYTSASTTLLQFFTTFNSDPAAQNGVFPFSNSYLLTAIGVYFPIVANTADLGGTNPGTNTTSNSPSTLNDLALLSNNGALQLKLDTKTYGPFPVIKLAPGCGFAGLFNIIGTNANKQSGIPQLGSNDTMFQLEVPLLVPAQTSTTLTLTWNATQSLSITSMPMRIYLEGIEAVTVG